MRTLVAACLLAAACAGAEGGHLTADVEVDRATAAAPDAGASASPNTTDAGLEAAPATPPSPTPPTSPISSPGVRQQLLRDPTFEGGLRYVNGTQRTAGEADLCNAMLQQNGIVDPEWGFTDVCEEGCFCNSPNPRVDGARIEYRSSTKSIVIDKAAKTITLRLNTESEWNEGCELNAETGGVAPDYQQANTPWNWHHLFVNQGLGRIAIDAHESLTLSAEFKITRSEKTSARDCPSWPKHLMFKMGVRLTPKAGVQAPGIFCVWKLWNTADGATFWTPSEGPFVAGDPIDDLVYHSPMGSSLAHPPVVPGRADFQPVRIDVKRLAREALAANRQTKKEMLNIAHYDITMLNFSVEAWGGYAVEVTGRNFSLVAENGGAALRPWYRYWNPTTFDHYYSTNFFPQGFAGFGFEGALGSISQRETPSSVPLYEYFNPTNKDHYYTPALFPFGAGDQSRCGFPEVDFCAPWEYAGLAGYVWLEPGPGRIPVYELWNARGDHLYSRRRAEGTQAGYQCVPDCDTPAFYLAR